MAKFCKKCGAQLSDEAGFCPNCGASQAPVTVDPSQVRQTVPPQTQPQAEQVPQQQVPQQQVPQQQVPQQQVPQQPREKKPSPFSKDDFGFKGSDFKMNPIKELQAGDLSRYSVLTLFLAISTMFCAELGMLRFVGFLGFLRVFGVVVFALTIIWFLFKMFLKRTTWFDHAIIAVGAIVIFLTVVINMIAGLVLGRFFAGFWGIVFYFIDILAIAAGVVPFIFKLIKKK